MSSQILTLSSACNQSLAVPLRINGGTVNLQLTLGFNAMAGYWVMNLMDGGGNPILSSLPLITGAWPASNILGAYQYMNIGSAYVINVSGVTTPDYPNATDLGTDFVILWDDNTNYAANTIYTPITGESSMIGPQGPAGPQGLPGYGAGNAGLAALTVSGSNVTPDLALGLTLNVTLGSTPLTILAPIWTNAVLIPGMQFTLNLIQDATGGRPCPTFTPFSSPGGGFASDTQIRIQNAPISYNGTPLTQTSLQFFLNASLRWIIIAGSSGALTS